MKEVIRKFIFFIWPLKRGLFFMKNQRSASEIITRMTTIAMLSALGFVLMAFAQFPYPIAPWLKIEISEIVTIIAYALYGLPGGISVALIKTNPKADSIAIVVILVIISLALL